MRHTFVFIEVFGCEGGIQSYIQDVLGAYDKIAPKYQATADVFLLRAPEMAHPLKSGALKYHYFKSARPWVERVRLSCSLLVNLLFHRPDHVFCGHINLATLVKVSCQLLGIPYTVLTYGKEVWYELPQTEKRALRAADSVWTISRYSRDLACAANQVSPDKFEMLPCVVDGSIFTPGPKPVDLIDRYQLQSSKVLMTVARLWPGDIYKGVDVTIRALPEIAQTFPTVKYVVIGRGDDQPRLAKLAEELGVAERVIFAGFVPDEALVAHYQLADVYVMPSKEGFGIVYLEAMACGVPVIAGDDDGSADPVQDGRLGWQVPHRDPVAVATACIEALSGEDARCDGTWLRSQTLDKFSAPALVSKVNELISKQC